ncbi:Ankrd52, partial [Symbiodinium natans]
AMNEILVQAGGSMSSWILNRAIYSATSFRGGQAQVIQRLIQVRADVNHKYPLKAVSLHALYLGVKGMQHRFGRVTNSTRQCYHAWGATPLMAALLSAQYEGAAALIAAGARIDLRNARGCTAAELVREQVLPRFLVEALQGRPQECQDITDMILAGKTSEV